ncbi:hypothetical protein PSACC_01152 [Paramicrosporidium saccamoebae]|uniref:4-hydroxybenzoate polyprenyltransferase, mitochondrial n=1 Tax=Paramicrosporidium saccamoebae TaxID=1246581 RepID=A0A2H9TMR8_9FUNG|nr:hypothetical protein PSACC_01152 [Paramicrosporidium saccamoebae]
MALWNRPLFRRMHPYTDLMRLDKPIGSWLLFWPSAWSLAFTPPVSLPLLALFATGAVVMRGAGCTINDLWDQRIDALVERTRKRPLPAGRLSTRQAVVFLGAQLSVGLVILLQLNWTSVAVGAASLLPVALYPLMKRVTYWPQFVLGLTFNWGVLLGWTAQTGTLQLPVVLPLYLAGISWTMLYDTIYALQDIKDDLQVGVKSTAIRFGGNVKRWLCGFAAVSISSFVVAGMQQGMSLFYYAGIAGAAVHMTWQIYTLRPHNVADCLSKFKSNRWLGAIVFAGILLDAAIPYEIAHLVSFRPFL